MNKAGIEILNSFRAFISGSAPLETFQEDVAVAHWDVEQRVPEMSGIVYLAVGKLSEYSRGHRTQESVRLELEQAISQTFGLKDRENTLAGTGSEPKHLTLK